MNRASFAGAVRVPSPDGEGLHSMTTFLVDFDPSNLAAGVSVFIEAIHANGRPHRASSVMLPPSSLGNAIPSVVEAVHGERLHPIELALDSDTPEPNENTIETPFGSAKV